MAYKIVISKVGYNVLTETDPNNLIFSSDYNTLKYYASGLLNLTFTGNGAIDQSTYVTHNLGYEPYFEAYVKDNYMAKWVPVGHFAAGVDYIQYFVYSTTTVLAVWCRGWASAPTSYDVDFRYFIFKNDLNI